MDKRLALILLVGSFALGALLLFPRLGGGDDVQVTAGELKTRLTADEVRAFSDLPLFWLGEEFEGLQLTAILPNYQSGDQTRITAVEFIYGDCDNSTSSCPVPLQVTNELLCGASPDPLLQLGEDPVRGIQPANYGSHLRFSTGASLVSVLSSQGPTPEEELSTVRRAVDRLQPANTAAELAGDGLALNINEAIDAGIRTDCYRGQGDIRAVATAIEEQPIPPTPTPGGLPTPFITPQVEPSLEPTTTVSAAEAQ